MAQSPAIQWQQALGGSATDDGWAVRPSADGGYIVAGTVQSSDGDVVGFHGGLADIWVVKLDASGNVEWTRALGGSENDIGTDIIQTQDLGYVVIGNSSSTDGDATTTYGGGDIWVVKLDAAGDLVWQKNYGGSNQETGIRIIETTAGDLMVVGETASSDGDVVGHQGFFDMWVLRLAANGTLLWQHPLGSVSGSDIANAIVETADGGFILTGNVGAGDGDVSGFQGGIYDIWLARLDASGQLLWEESYGGSGNDQVGDVLLASNGDLILVASSNSTDGDISGPIGSSDLWVISVDSTGLLLWEKSYGGSNGDSGSRGYRAANGDLVVFGASSSSDVDVNANYGAQDAWLVRIDNSGSILWEQNFGGTAMESNVRGFSSAPDGGYVFACTTASNNVDVSGNSGGQDLWVVKLAPDHTAIGDMDKGIPVMELWPNPACNVIHIVLEGVDAITLFSATGSSVSLPSEAFKCSSSDRCTLDVRSLTPGAYVLHLESSSQPRAGRFVKE